VEFPSLPADKKTGIWSAAALWIAVSATAPVIPEVSQTMISQPSAWGAFIAAARLADESPRV
jgi:hypothetical protein